MDNQPWPSELNATRASHPLELKDKLTVRYAIDARDSNDVGSIQANHPVPSKCSVFYYELTVLDQGRFGRIAIGFADRSFKLTRQPGWEVGSFGYHGDDGKKFIGSGMGEDYGPPFGTGDTVGAGIHLGRQELFFTKNGTKLKVAHRGVRPGLYPTIGLHSKGEMVTINFGQKPFVFDLEGMLSEERAAQRAAVERIPVAPGTTHQLVRQYLLHYGHEDTLRAFDEAAGPVQEAAGAARPADAAAAAAGDAATALALRASLRRALMSGEVDQALSLLAAQCPDVLADPGRFGDVHFHLACQKYIELVRRGCIQEAVLFAQGTLAQLRGSSAAELEASLRDVVALVAYQDPAASPLAHLLGQAQRDAVADAVNAAVLAVMADKAAAAARADGSGNGGEDSPDGDEEAKEAEEDGGEESRGGGEAGTSDMEGDDGGAGAGAKAWSLRPALWTGEQQQGPAAAGAKPESGTRPVSHLEALLRQLVAVQGTLHEVNGGQGGVFNLQEYMLGPPR